MSYIANRNAQIFVFLFAACGVGAAQSTSTVNANILSAPLNTTTGAVGVSPVANTDPSLVGSTNSGQTENALFNAGSQSFNPSYSGPKQTNLSNTLSGRRAVSENPHQAAAAALSGWRGQTGAFSAASVVPSSVRPVPVRDLGGGSYSTSFPDSAKGTANISPPADMNTASFGFAPSLGNGFNDLSQHQFLNPQLRVGMPSGRRRSKQDLYRRLEAYLKKKQSKEGLSSSEDQLSTHPASPFSAEQNRLKSNSMFDNSNSTSDIPKF